MLSRRVACSFTGTSWDTPYTEMHSFDQRKLLTEFFYTASGHVRWNRLKRSTTLKWSRITCLYIRQGWAQQLIQ
jgi:hypothetical protein